MKVAFFGTPAFAVPTLAGLLESVHPVVCVVTQPDRPRGRGQRVQVGPVKALAETAGIPVLQPDRLKDPAVLAEVRRHGAEIGVVAAYGRLLPQSLLDLLPAGFINVHASLLPRWRGAAPIHRAIIAGDAMTGVTIMRVVLALDAGPMLAVHAMPVTPEDTSVTLEGRLASEGARLLVETLDQLAVGPLPERAQDERLVTYAARLERRDSEIHWQRSAHDVHNQIRGLLPWPQAGARIDGRRVSFRRSRVEPDVSGAPGTIVRVDADAFVVAAGAGGVAVLELQEEGRPAMTARAYLNGRRLGVGTRLQPLTDEPGP